jgi:Tfp pilus assembly protein PilN
LLALGLLCICVWAALTTHALRKELVAANAAHDGERQRLTAALGDRNKSGSDLSALTQELTQANVHLAERRALLSELRPPPGDAHARSSLLLLLARTVPESVWLSEVRLRDGQVRLKGTTLQPAALRRWLNELAADPALAGQSLRQVKVERDEPEGHDGHDGHEKPQGAAESWSFSVISRSDDGSSP